LAYHSIDSYREAREAAQQQAMLSRVSGSAVRHISARYCARRSWVACLASLMFRLIQGEPMPFEVAVPDSADFLRPYSIQSTRISPHNLPSLLSFATYSPKGDLRFHSASSGVAPYASSVGTSSRKATNPPLACRITLPVNAVVLRTVCGKLVDFATGAGETACVSAGMSDLHMVVVYRLEIP